MKKIMLKYAMILGSACIYLGVGAVVAFAQSREAWDAGSAMDFSTSRNSSSLSRGILADAVDAPSLTWITGGDADWFGQMAITYDGVDAAQSGSITHNQQSWMQTTVSGPGTISFWWQVSSEANFDYLRFYVDGVEQAGAISWVVNWQQKSYSIPSGNHTLKWAYTKDSTVSSELDCGWVDQVVWTPITLSPVYRFWSAKFRGHFYTISENEKNNIIANLSQDWTYEGISYYAYDVAVIGPVPVYRFWSAKTHGHFYTISESEKNNLIANLSRDWSYEGIAYYAYPTVASSTLPVFRFWSPKYRHHFYTISESEKNNIIANLSQDWSYEGIAYYAIASDLSLGVRAVSFSSKKSTSGTETLEDRARSSSVFETGLGEVVFPLTVADSVVKAYVFDSATEKWTDIANDSDSQTEAVFTDVQPNRDYRIEVWAADPAQRDASALHASAFTWQLDPPIELNSSVASSGVDGIIGVPLARVKVPATDGTLTLKLYSATEGVIETQEHVSGGGTAEFSLPEWNCWYWVGGWRDSDNALVFSIWLRHETEE